MQDQWAIVHRRDSHAALVGAAEAVWKCTSNAALRRMCLDEAKAGPENPFLEWRQVFESTECALTVHLHHAGLRIVTAVNAFGRAVTWQYDAVHAGVYGTKNAK